MQKNSEIKLLTKQKIEGRDLNVVENLHLVYKQLYRQVGLMIEEAKLLLVHLLQDVVEQKNERALTNQDKLKIALVNECLKIINKD